jgi:hypothetical protein
MRFTEITTLQPLRFRCPYIQIPFLGADLLVCLDAFQKIEDLLFIGLFNKRMKRTWRQVTPVERCSVPTDFSRKTR